MQTRTDAPATDSSATLRKCKQCGADQLPHHYIRHGCFRAEGTAVPEGVDPGDWSHLIKAWTRLRAGNLRTEHIGFGEVPGDVVADRGPQPASEQVERRHRNTTSEDDAEHRHQIGTGFDQMCRPE